MKLSYFFQKKILLNIIISNNYNIYLMNLNLNINNINDIIVHKFNEDMLKLGNKYYESGNIELSKIYFTILANQDLDDGYYNLGTVYFMENDYNNAIKYYNLTKKFKNYKSFNNLGIIYLKMNDLEKAKYYFLLSIKYNDIYPKAHYNVGLVYDKLKNIELSLEYFEKSALLGYLDGMIYMANHFRNINNLYMAKEYYLMIIQYDFNIKNPYINLIEICNNQIQYNRNNNIKVNNTNIIFLLIKCCMILYEIGNKNDRANIVKNPEIIRRKIQFPIIYHIEQHIGDIFLYFERYDITLDFYRKSLEKGNYNISNNINIIKIFLNNNNNNNSSNNVNTNINTNINDDNNNNNILDDENENENYMLINELIKSSILNINIEDDEYIENYKINNSKNLDINTNESNFYNCDLDNYDLDIVDSNNNIFIT